MIAAIFLALAVGQTTVGEAAAIDQISQCGIPRETIRAMTDRAGTVELTVAAAPPPGGDEAPAPSNIDCVVTAAIGGKYWVEFADNGAREQFEHAYGTLRRAQDKAAGTQWLTERGMLGALPLFDGAEDSLAGYGRKIETFCGMAPGAIVHQYDVMVLAYKKRAPGSPVTNMQIECLSRAFGASNLNSDYDEFFFGVVVDQAGVIADGSP